MGMVAFLGRYLFSHYLYGGLRVAAGVLGTTLLAFALFGPDVALAVSTGALCVSFADVPEPLGRKWRGLVAALVLGVLGTLALGQSRASDWGPWLVMPAIGFGAGMLVAYGRSAMPLSFVLLFTATMALGTPMAAVQPFAYAALFAAGGLVYLAYALPLARYHAFRTRQQALAECLYELACYLEIKAGFYEPGVDLDRQYGALVRQQAALAERQQAARDLVFERLDSAADATLACTLLASLEVYEEILSSHTDYALLRRVYADSEALAFLRDLILKGAREVEGIAARLMRDREPRPRVSFKAELFALEHELGRLRAAVASPEAAQAYAALVGARDKVGQAVARIAELHAVARTPVPPQGVLGGADLTPFVGRPSYAPRLLLEQLTPASPVLRYALRLALALGAGLALTAVLPYAAHGYWIVLTIAVVLRPNFSLTRQRLKDRLAGNLVGCVLAAAILQTEPPPLAVLALIFVANTVAHACVSLRYRYTAIAACVLVLLQIHLLHPGGFAIAERLLDTLVGVAIAYGFSYVLPSWERTGIRRQALALLDAAAAFAREALAAAPQDLEYRLARKRLHEAVAGLSGAFGRMLAEPAAQHRAVAALERFIALSYLLSAQLVAVRRLLLRRGGEIDAATTARLLHETDAAVQGALRRASLEFARPIAETPPPEDTAAAPEPADAAGWSVERLLERRLALIRDNARELQAIAPALAG